MKVLISAFVILLFSSYSSLEFNNSTLNERKANSEGKLVNLKSVKSNVLSDMILVQLSNGTSLHWSNQSSKIIEDSLFREVSVSFPKKRMSLIALISDTTETQAKACGVDKNLLVGDISFLLIDKIKMVPYFKVLGVQWDTYDMDCPYPFGLLDYINSHRDEVRKKVKSYIL